MTRKLSIQAQTITIEYYTLCRWNCDHTVVKFVSQVTPFYSSRNRAEDSFIGDISFIDL